MQEEQHHRLSDLDDQINGIEEQLKAVAKQNKTCQRLLEIPGVGQLIATTAVAPMGEASALKSGREFAAYVGRVPKQTGSGGKIRPSGKSKRGNTYLQTLFIYGSRAASLLAKAPIPWIEDAPNQRGCVGHDQQAGKNGMGDIGSQSKL